MIKICMLGAVDRFNYGDLLLPIIVLEKIKSYDNKNEITITNYGIVKSDLSHLGALTSKSLSDFYEDCQKKNTSVIIIGGEVLNAEWGNIYSYLNSKFSKLYSFNTLIFRRYAFFVNNFIAKNLISGKTKRPFVLDKKKLKIPKALIYNGVGGNRDFAVSKSQINDVSLLRCDNVDYISTRDQGIYNKLINASVECHLTPDSAILMSTIYKKENFAELTNLTSNKIFNESFIFFQISKRELDLFGSKKIAEKLTSVSKKNGSRIVLCPIGTALGHEDHIALEEINNILDESVLKFFIKEPSIWDIMFLISHSKLYIGSSLHGVITAMSYSVPYLAIRNSTKIEYYLKTWAPQELNLITVFDDLDWKVDIACNISHEKLELSKEIQINISEKSFLDMYNVLLKKNLNG